MMMESEPLHLQEKNPALQSHASLEGKGFTATSAFLPGAPNGEAVNISENPGKEYFDTLARGFTNGWQGLLPGEGNEGQANGECLSLLSGGYNALMEGGPPEGKMLPPRQRGLEQQQDGSNPSPESGSDKDAEQTSSQALAHPLSHQITPGSCDEIDKQREKNRNAQKRFRQRQKEKMKVSQDQLILLTQQMNRLAEEKTELESRNKILKHIVRINADCIDRLQIHEEVRVPEQMLLLKSYIRFVNMVEQMSCIGLEEAKEWRFSHLICHKFQNYIDLLKTLYIQASRDPGSAAMDQLSKLVNIRREVDKASALFSSFHWAVYCWNIHETKRQTRDAQGKNHGAEVLAGLRLTGEQEDDILSARRNMLTRLVSASNQRRAIISRLGLETLQNGRERLYSCPAILYLRKSLEEEREAVSDFLYAILDEILSPLQEAYLDTSSYPWSSDIWEVANLLAERRKEPRQAAPALAFESSVLDPILPHATPFKILTTPITAIGMGSRLKRSILMYRHHSVAPKAAFPLLSQKQLGSRTMLEIQCGMWKKQPYCEWQRLCVQNGDLISNELTETDEGYISP